MDTNEVSELRQIRLGRAGKNLAIWADSISPGALFRTWLSTQVLPAFATRILPVDTAVAIRSAALHVSDPRPFRDSLIAATALVHGMTLVTRNVADFQASGAALTNPWDGSAASKNNLS